MTPPRHAPYLSVEHVRGGMTEEYETAVDAEQDANPLGLSIAGGVLGTVTGLKRGGVPGAVVGGLAGGTVGYLLGATADSPATVPEDRDPISLDVSDPHESEGDAAEGDADDEGGDDA